MNHDGLTLEPDAVAALMGAELYQVAFVRDYVQLGLEPAAPEGRRPLLSVAPG